ncbi:MAG: ABC transporter ATP-binding protein [Myxococcota bacterium]
MSAPAVAFRDVSVTLGERPVLSGVSLDVAAGCVLGLAGRNGAGKTTLFRVASRVLAPDGGGVCVGGDPVAELSRRELARRLAVVPQDVAVAFPFTAGEVVLMGRAPHASGLGFESERDVAIAREVMQDLGIAALADRSMLELSGGERQLVLVARALAQQPDVLLLDEPTSHLDLRHRTAVLERVRRFAADGGCALVVSHDLTLAARTCDAIALLRDGRLDRVGPPLEVLTSETLRRVFDVDADVLHAPDGAPLVVPRSVAS